MKPEEIPPRGLQLRSLVTEHQTVEVSLVEVDVPSPGPDEVLVRVEAAPINPSDLAVLFAGADIAHRRGERHAGIDLSSPTPLSEGAARAAEARVGQSMPVGNEGAGTVVSAGGSDRAQALLGRRVALYGGAMYAQYRCVNADACLALPPGASPAAGAASFVNPMTVLGDGRDDASGGPHGARAHRRRIDSRADAASLLPRGGCPAGLHRALP